MKNKISILALRLWVYFCADSVLDRDIVYNGFNAIVYYASDVKKWVVEPKND